MNQKIYIASFIVIMISCSLYTIDNPHFYRATNAIFNEPRIEHDYLTSVDITLAQGSTHKSRNSNHYSVPLLSLYGTTDARILGLNLPEHYASSPYQQLFSDLANLPSDNNHGKLSPHGHFKIIESNLSLTQNLSKGFLLFFHIPIRYLSIKNPYFIDVSPDLPTIPEWQTFLTSFANIMEYYDINICSTHETGFGDFTTLIGWTHNYQATEVLDFIDGTIMTGILIPTGKKRNPDQLFSLPLGYNGHWAIPLNAMFSIGTYEWITIGAYAHALFFIKNNQAMRLKTSLEQSGIIKLAKGNVTVKKGTAWNTGIYLKADHFMYGLSFTAGYSYSGEQKETICPHDSITFDATIINSDTTLKGWNMHTLQLMAEYDFTKEYSKIGPRIGAFYNHQLQGTRVFKTNMTGATFGLDIGWDL